MGDSASATGNNSVALGAGSTDGGKANVVSIGAVGAERMLINVAPGAISKTSTDGINGGQIYANQDSVVAALGGGTKVNPDGTISTPSFVIGATTYNDVGSALTGLASGGAKSKYFNATSTLADSVASGTDSVAIGPVALSKAANGVSIGNGA